MFQVAHNSETIVVARPYLATGIYEQVLVAAGAYMPGGQRSPVVGRIGQPTQETREFAIRKPSDVQCPDQPSTDESER